MTKNGLNDKKSVVGNGNSLERVRPLHVLPMSAIDLIVGEGLGVCHLTQQGYGGLMYGVGQISGQSGVGSLLSANDSTSRTFVLRCNKFLVDTSWSTSSSLYLEIRCCIDRLKPQSLADLIHTSMTPRRC